MFNYIHQPGKNPAANLARKVLADTAVDSRVEGSDQAYGEVCFYVHLLCTGKHEVLAHLMRHRGLLGEDEELKDILPPPLPRALD